MYLQSIKNNHPNIPWLESRTILLVRHGSHAYSLNVESSDEDLKGIYIAPLENRLGLNKVTEQVICSTPWDYVIYDLQKFITLATDNNPNIIEVIFTDPSDVLVSTKLGEKLLKFRDNFLSKRLRWTFGGFALDKLKDLKQKRDWLLNPPKEMPTREKFGLTEYEKDHQKLTQVLSTIEAKIGSWNLGLDELSYSEKIRIKGKIKEAMLEIAEGSLFRTAAKCLNFSDNLIELLDKEKSYRNSLQDWKNYKDWERNRNPKRAELEAKVGYDTKDVTHLLRLTRVATEGLLTHKINVRREDREELLEFRLGNRSWDDVEELAKKEFEKMEQAYSTSTLPNTPDLKLINDFCSDLLKASF